MAKTEGVKLHGNTWTLISTDITPSTSAYAAGDLVGTAILEFKNAVQSDIGGGVVIGASIIDSSTTATGLELILFDRPLVTTSVTGDNAAFDLADAEQDYVVAQYVFASGDAKQLADNQIYMSTDNTKYGFYLPSGQSIYGVLVARGTPTYSSNQALAARIVVQRDA